MCLSAFQLNNVLIFRSFFLLSFMVISLNCVGGRIPKKPSWVYLGKVSPPYYVGQSTLQADKKNALDDAFYDAIKDFYSMELGITVQSETYLRKREHGNEVVVEYESNIYTQVFIANVRVRRKEKYLESEKEGYRAYVRIYIPEEEVMRVRQEVEEYINEILEYTKKEVRKGEQLEEKRSYIQALLAYKTAAKILEASTDQRALALRKKIEAKIQTLLMYEDPGIQLMGLKSSDNFLDFVELINLNREKVDNFVNVGDEIRLHITVKIPVFLYILSYEKDEKEVRLLYPNWIEKVESRVSGELLFPQNSCFTAEPPSGLNKFIVIATPDKLPLKPDFDKKKVNLSGIELQDFILDLKEIGKYEIRKIDVFIRE